MRERKRRRVFCALFQKYVDRIGSIDGRIDSRVGSAFVRPDVDKVFGFLECPHQVTNFECSISHFGIHQVRHQAADAAQNIDAWIVAARSQLAIEDDVSVENGTDGVGDRIVHVIAFNQDRVERRNAAFLEFSRPLKKPGQ